jgi:hypothetical protein
MAHRLSFGLSRELWLVQVGIFLNYLGYGAVVEFPRFGGRLMVRLPRSV